MPFPIITAMKFLGIAYPHFKTPLSIEHIYMILSWTRRATTRGKTGKTVVFWKSRMRQQQVLPSGYVAATMVVLPAKNLP